MLWKIPIIWKKVSKIFCRKWKSQQLLFEHRELESQQLLFEPFFHVISTVDSRLSELIGTGSSSDNEKFG